MTENERFIQVVDTLKKIGFLSTDTELAEQLGTNKAGISDIRHERKGLSLHLLRSLKKSYAVINLNWIIMGEGEMFIASEVKEINVNYQKAIKSNESCNLCKEKDKRLLAQEKLIKMLERQLKM